MKIKEAFSEFLEGLAGQSASNRYNYSRRLESFVDTYGEMSVASVKSAVINKWLNGILERGYREATISGYRQALKAFWNYCVKQKWITESPAAHVGIGKFISGLPKLPPEEAVNRMAEVAAEWLKAEDNPTKTRNGLFFLLSMRSGPRLREIRELRKSEVEAALRQGPDNYGIYRCRSYGKTKEVMLRFDEELADAFRRWLALRPSAALVDCCFVGMRPSRTKNDPKPRYRPLSKTAAIDIYREIAQEAGVERAVLSHALRHRLGHKTTTEYDPKIAAMILNHKDWQSAATAIKYYYHPQERDVSRVLASYNNTQPSNELGEMERLFGLKKK